MTADPGEARAAAERTARAVMTGNLAQVMADLAPEAMAQLMQLASGAQGLSPAQLPGIDGFELEEQAAEEGEARFLVRFRSSAGTVAVATRWRPMLGQWKVVEIGLAGFEAPGQPGPAAGG
ncbi:hypothetical protein [Tepidiforma sp.]|uniref:hypothetical protein n=1 Tax=Tepidiforma sp. TaxID=2682230 RepID=UPI0021DF38FA|nr:hypothetical protein [Tepidiforma sp.]MCX7616454.1 hypothetical protein [Tepidiforma sp.]GIW19170.1 MAG: hypothetical protein KatS3mg064_2327 [Tepidiforma sp.]